MSRYRVVVPAAALPIPEAWENIGTGVEVLRFGWTRAIGPMVLVEEGEPDGKDTFDSAETAQAVAALSPLEKGLPLATNGSVCVIERLEAEVVYPASGGMTTKGEDY